MAAPSTPTGGNNMLEPLTPAGTLWWPNLTMDTRGREWGRRSAEEQRVSPEYYAWLRTSIKGTVIDQSQMHWRGGEIREIVSLGMEISLIITSFTEIITKRISWLHGMSHGICKDVVEQDETV